LTNKIKNLKKLKILKIKNHVQKIESLKIMSTSRPHVKNHKIQNLKKIENFITKQTNAHIQKGI